MPKLSISLRISSQEALTPIKTTQQQHRISTAATMATIIHVFFLSLPWTGCTGGGEGGGGGGGGELGFVGQGRFIRLERGQLQGIRDHRLVSGGKHRRFSARGSCFDRGTATSTEFFVGG